MNRGRSPAERARGTDLPPLVEIGFIRWLAFTSGADHGPVTTLDTPGTDGDVLESAIYTHRDNQAFTGETLRPVIELACCKDRIERHIFAVPLD